MTQQRRCWLSKLVTFFGTPDIPGDSKKTQQNLEPPHFVRSKPSIVKPHKANDTSTLINCFKFHKNWLSIKTTVSQSVTPTLWRYYRRVSQSVIDLLTRKPFRVHILEHRDNITQPILMKFTTHDKQ